jgi:ubiquinone/menaquinone biosynthesis C-methylase UbiE
MDLTKQTESFDAQDLAGKAILFEIGAKAGILDVIENNQDVTVFGLSQKLAISQAFLQSYLDILVSLDILSKKESERISEPTYSKGFRFQKEKNKVGYISWGMNSCAPLIEHTKEFISDFSSAVKLYHRDGEHVALTSRWMGEKDFYPYAEEEIIKLRPKKVIDLGSGTCGLLIRLAQKIEDMMGIGVDISKDACTKAKDYINQVGLSDRIEVVESPIQDLVRNESIFLDADVVHAGFVFHDLLPDEEKHLDNLLACINRVAPNSTLVIVDAIPFSQNHHERAFSSAFSFLHRFYMGREFLTESAWKTKLNNVGFNHVHIRSLGISGGRIFVAKK